MKHMNTTQREAASAQFLEFAEGLRSCSQTFKEKALVYLFWPTRGAEFILPSGQKIKFRPREHDRTEALLIYDEALKMDATADKWERWAAELVGQPVPVAGAAETGGS